MKTRILSTVAAAGAIAVLGFGSPAAADSSAAGCWGTVTSQRAQVEGSDFGAHSASFDTPRAGIGNVAKAFDVSVGELGQFLASVDNIDETSC